jgi:hypothetical protein
MKKIKRLTLAAAGLTLAVTAVGAPAAASSHPAQIAIIQGIHGIRVDLCLGRKPIRSNVRYGWKTFRVLDPEAYTLKVYKHDPRKCKGVKIAQLSFDLLEHGDLSMVLAKGTPKVIRFDNSALPPVRPAVEEDPYLVARHAAKAPAMDWWVSVPVGPSPATEFAFHKGDEYASSVSGETAVLGTAWSYDGRTKLLTNPKVLHLLPDRRYEIYLIGSKKKNYKQAIFSRPFFNEP